MLNDLNFIGSLHNHQAWLQLPWEIKGMALHLMYYAKDNNGYLPEDSSAWRAILGFESFDAISRAFGDDEEQNKIYLKSSVTRWKWIEGELKKWFIQENNNEQYLRQWRGLTFLVDNSFQNQSENNSSVAVTVSSDVINLTTNEGGKAKDKKSVVKKKAAKSTKGKLPARPSLPIYEEYNYKPIRFTDSQLRRYWNEPMTEEQRHTIWDVGASLIGGSPDKAKVYLVKLIKQFGEKALFNAIVAAAKKNPPPINYRSYIYKIAEKEAGGETSSAPVTASSKRSRLAL